MSKRPFVLQALSILGLEEMLKLSEILNVKQSAFKKAAGEELIVWDDAPQNERPKTSSREEATVIPFPKKSILDTPPPTTEEIKGESDKTEIVGSDLLLWQREISRTKGEQNQKLDAFKGYKKSNEMYVVKESSSEGKDKIRFASTNGILVNKKQA